jgi:hypothetical protein
MTWLVQAERLSFLGTGFSGRGRYWYLDREWDKEAEAVASPRQ